MNTVDDELREREEITLAALVSDLARRLGMRVASAECLTDGRISSRMGNARHAQDWYVGGIVADTEQVKRQVLGVRASSVVSEQAAREMATAARTLFAGDLCVAVTGARDPLGRPSGRVCFAIADKVGVLAESRHLVGPDVASRVTEYALTLVRRRLTAQWQRHRAA